MTIRCSAREQLAQKRETERAARIGFVRPADDAGAAGLHDDLGVPVEQDDDRLDRPLELLLRVVLVLAAFDLMLLVVFFLRLTALLSFDLKEATHVSLICLR